MKKLRIILPMLAFLMAIAGAFATKASTVDNTEFYGNRFKLPNLDDWCFPCVVSEGMCSTVVGIKRCRCFAVYYEDAYNMSCQVLFKPNSNN